MHESNFFLKNCVGEKPIGLDNSNFHEFFSEFVSELVDVNKNKKYRHVHMTNSILMAANGFYYVLCTCTAY